MVEDAGGAGLLDVLTERGEDLIVEGGILLEPAREGVFGIEDEGEDVGDCGIGVRGGGGCGVDVGGGGHCSAAAEGERGG